MNYTSRELVLPEHTWNLTSFYSDISSWESDFSFWQARSEEFEKNYRGTLHQSSERLLSLIEEYLAVTRALEKLYTFAHLQSDQDQQNSKNLALVDRALQLFASFGAASGFLVPEIIALDDKTLHGFLSTPSLKPYSRLIRHIARYKAHTLSAAEESLLARASEVFSGFSRIFSMLSDADLDFGELPLNGKKTSLTHSTFSLFLKSTNRDTRKSAYEQYYQGFANHKNTLAASLAHSIKRDNFIATSRRFGSALEGALFDDYLPSAVYTGLIEQVHQGLPALHEYYNFRKNKLGLDELRIYDTYVPLVPEVKTHIGYEAAAELIVEATKPLGPEYQEILKTGLLTNRWVDRYENEGKRSGAYSSGCFDSQPYILMNYKDDDLSDLFTLAHEAGHSMHSFLTNLTQPYQDHSYTIFVAEVASIVHEQLLYSHLREVHCHDEKMLAFLLQHEIEDIRATFFRQVMFAEFEKYTHEESQAGSALTVDSLLGRYRCLLELYFGGAVALDDLIPLESLRIPHFYSSFYVYKYATGIAAATTLSAKLLTGDSVAKEKYLAFLKAGCSKPPIELLCDAGVDLLTPTPVAATVTKFSSLINKLKEL